MESDAEILKKGRRALANQKEPEGPHRAMSLRAGLSALNALNQRFCLRALDLSRFHSLSPSQVFVYGLAFSQLISV